MGILGIVEREKMIAEKEAELQRVEHENRVLRERNDLLEAQLQNLRINGRNDKRIDEIEVLRTQVNTLTDRLSEKEKSLADLALQRQSVAPPPEIEEERKRLSDLFNKLKSKEEKLKERTRAIKEQETKIATIKLNAMKEIEELQKERLTQREAEALEEKIAKLNKVESASLEWIKKKEKNEIALYKEMIQNVEAYKHFCEIFQEMDGYKFENYIGDLIKSNGFKDVIVTQKSNDFGGDIVADYCGAKYVFQCKYYSSPVGISAVQEALSARSHYKAQVAVAVTNNIFTTAAKILARESDVVLWDFSKIEELARNHDV